ncbi:MAG: beta-galactosidase trimerization domain-containing protein, partial [Clostridia bacterium]|nr:beta-galactosidase trimerization domain-containing protein [Clostridia bacterium]
SHAPYDEVWLGKDTEVAELAKYPVLFYPHAVIMTEARAQLLEAYVQQGGTLIIGCRTGYKDETGKCVMLPQPGLLGKLSGTDVTDFTFASPAEEAPTILWVGEALAAPIFADILHPAEDAKVLACHNTSYFKGQPALTEHAYGAGRVLHWGAGFSVAAVRKLLAYTGAAEPFRHLMEVPENVELVVREKDGRQYLFVLNYKHWAESVRLNKPMKSLLSGEICQGEVTLPPYGVDVFEVE